MECDWCWPARAEGTVSVVVAVAGREEVMMCVNVRNEESCKNISRPEWPSVLLPSPVRWSHRPAWSQVAAKPKVQACVRVA